MLRAVGYDIVRAKAWRRTQGDILEHIIALGFRPRTVIDVGVGNGTPWLYGHFREANLLLVERVEGRGEDQAIWRKGIEEGLLAHPVTGGVQGLGPIVPDGEGEHPVDPA